MKRKRITYKTPSGKNTFLLRKASTEKRRCKQCDKKIDYITDKTYEFCSAECKLFHKIIELDKRLKLLEVSK